MQIKVNRVEGLTGEVLEAEDRAIALINSDLTRLVSAYRERFGRVVGTDTARELFPDYANGLEARLKYAVAVQRSAAALADAVYIEMVSENQNGLILFTAGGTGAGKTTTIKQGGGSAYDKADVIYDSNLNSKGSARSKLDFALSHNCQLAVSFVHRHPVEAYLQGVLPRALEEGRTVPIEKHLRMHGDSLKTFLWLQRQYKSNPFVVFVILINTGYPAEVLSGDLDYLKAIEYDKAALITAIKEGLQRALTNGKISEALYEASSGGS
jgi:hypothetical protein